MKIMIVQNEPTGLTALSCYLWYWARKHIDIDFVLFTEHQIYKVHVRGLILQQTNNLRHSVCKYQWIERCKYIVGFDFVKNELTEHKCWVYISSETDVLM